MEEGIRIHGVENMKLGRGKEANPDICAIKRPYLTNQEEFLHKIIFMDSKLNKVSFTSGIIFKSSRTRKLWILQTRGFSAPYSRVPAFRRRFQPNHEAESSRINHGLQDVYPILQKAINQKKWPRELEVMINLSKLVKPVLHLPYLEDGRFNQCRTNICQPGDIRHDQRLPEDI